MPPMKSSRPGARVTVAGSAKSNALAVVLEISSLPPFGSRAKLADELRGVIAERGLRRRGCIVDDPRASQIGRGRHRREVYASAMRSTTLPAGSAL